MLVISPLLVLQNWNAWYKTIWLSPNIIGINQLMNFLSILFIGEAWKYSEIYVFVNREQFLFTTIPKHLLTVILFFEIMAMLGSFNCSFLLLEC